MNIDVRSRFIWTVVLSAAFAACGGEAEADGTGGAGSGGSQPSGGASGSGGSGVGGSAESGGAESGGAESGGAESGSSPSTGGAETGGASSGGAVASGGGDGSGGSLDGTGGSWAGCDCDAPSVLVCGSDGQTYDAGCGEACVPVAIECEGECPCADCGCVKQEGQVCREDGQPWLCEGAGWDWNAAIDAGCEDLVTGAQRFCCPSSVTADAFCEE